jgi:RNA polymerase sigma-70 factor (ECF subfamily)
MSELRPDSAETHQLLEQAQAGDREAFERLFSRYRSSLRQVIAQQLDPKLRARLDASDIVQETQLEAFRRLADFLQRQPMPFHLWLRKTAHQQLLIARRQHLQTAGRTVTRELPLPDGSSLLLAQQLLAAGSTPSQQLAQRELASRVRQALAQLSEADREMVILRAYEGLSNQEVSYVLDLDPGTASKRHGRALLRLHQILSEGGLTESQL